MCEFLVQKSLISLELFLIVARIWPKVLWFPDTEEPNSNAKKYPIHAIFISKLSEILHKFFNIANQKNNKLSFKEMPEVIVKKLKNLLKKRRK